MRNLERGIGYPEQPYQEKHTNDVFNSDVAEFVFEIKIHSFLWKDYSLFFMM